MRHLPESASVVDDSQTGHHLLAPWHNQGSLRSPLLLVEDILPPIGVGGGDPSAAFEALADIFRLYSRPNPFREIQICSYPSLDIQNLIQYPYPNIQIAYL